MSCSRTQGSDEAQKAVMENRVNCDGTTFPSRSTLFVSGFLSER